MAVSRRLLRLLSAVVWYIGGIVLTLKAVRLLQEAAELRDGRTWLVVAVVVGLVVGALKGFTFFGKSCRRNLDRIGRLQEPKPWQFFRLRFFLFMAIMITTGSVLSRMASGNYAFLVSVAALDLSIATALLTSSSVFWKWKAARD